AEDGIRDFHVTGVQTCALPICAQVLLGELAELLRDRRERVEVRARLPRRGDGRGERVHERVHVRGVEVVLLVPGGGGEDDVGEEIGRASCRERGSVWEGGGG